MFRNTLIFATTATALTLAAASAASACNVVGHTSDGEPLCATTSDGAGQQYRDGRSGRDRWLERRRAERQSRLQALRPIRHQGWNW